VPTGATGTYDNNSELTSTTLAGTTTNYAYNADGQRLTSKQGSTTITSGTWNGAGQLTAYTSPAASMTAATYDGTGLRASTTTGSGSQAFTWNTTGQIPQLLMDSSNAYISGTGLAPAEQVNLSTGAISYLTTDSLGSVRGTVSSAGTLTATTAYDAWGNPETTGGLSAATPFGYAGGYTDPTGLIYLINRYYDPQTGQFISVDAMVSQTLQPYQYASGNPVSNTDPTGRWVWNCGYVTCTIYMSRHWTRWAANRINNYPGTYWSIVGGVVALICLRISGGNPYAAGLCGIIIGPMIGWYTDTLSIAANRHVCFAIKTSRVLWTWWHGVPVPFVVPYYPEATNNRYCYN
jgi:RHS repeat-associated protein